MSEATDDPTRVLFVRVPQSLIAALDVAVERERKMHPGRKVSRSGVARELLYKALEVLDERSD